MYGCPGLLRAVTRGVPRCSHDALALGVLRALGEAGCGAAGQTDAVLVSAAAAGHVAVTRWAMQEGATAYDRALRASCTHGHVDVVRLLLGVLVAGRPQATATESHQQLQEGGNAAGGSGDEGHGMGLEDFPGAPRSAPGLPLPLPLPLLLNTALGDAAKCGDKVVVELLLEAGADAQHEHSAALRHAATWGNEDALAALLAAGADPRDGQDAALRAAAEYGHGGVVRQLLAAGVPGVDGKNWALSQAAIRGQAGVVELLLRAGPWPQGSLDTLLFVVKLKMRQGSGPPPALCWEARRGRLQEVAQELEAAGAHADRFEPSTVRLYADAFEILWRTSPVFRLAVVHIICLVGVPGVPRLPSVRCEGRGVTRGPERTGHACACACAWLSLSRGWWVSCQARWIC